ncbi:MAG: nucleoside phosphorylase [Chloroflexota bacterium]|nr:nucleoside phosphorylase [Chloroflexota bacterium]MDQ3512651.1 nucleoside phosphorylase [Chloroflexota bacterium]
MRLDDDAPGPLLHRTDHAEPSVFLPENLLREARRQLGLADGRVPSVCLLDPDGDVVRHLRRTDQATRSETWACYHTELWGTEVDGVPIGIVGCAVGAPFAVLVAEQLFASGCELLVSVTSAGLIETDAAVPRIILIERALRAEGTSSAYLPAMPYSEGDPVLLDQAAAGLGRAGLDFVRGTTWTTDTPYRETASALGAAAAAGIMAVEMEAAGLYAFAAARDRPVVCFAHVTNQMAQVAGDFEKGPANGVDLTLALVASVATGVATGGDPN